MNCVFAPKPKTQVAPGGQVGGSAKSPSPEMQSSIDARWLSSVQHRTDTNWAKAADTVIVDNAKTALMIPFALVISRRPPPWPGLFLSLGFPAASIGFSYG
jgi:hypothetical protein